MNNGKYLLGEVKNITEKAVLLSLLEYEGEDGKVVKATGGPFWFPLSQISEEDFVVGLQVEVEVPSWLMRDKGLL